MHDTDKKYFLEKPGAIRKLWILLWVSCGLTLVPEFFLHRHSYFGMDSTFGFFAGLGFFACAILILLAKGIGFALKKREDYYND